MTSAAHAIRILVDPPAAGAWNMAVDEVLLARSAERGEAVLRVYRWTPATLSLGYFQQAAERATHAASRAPAYARGSTPKRSRRAGTGWSITSQKSWLSELPTQEFVFIRFLSRSVGQW